LGGIVFPSGPVIPQGESPSPNLSVNIFEFSVFCPVTHYSRVTSPDPVTIQRERGKEKCEEKTAWNKNLKTEVSHMIIIYHSLYKSIFYGYIELGC
jgi:hypothetical protein